MTQFTLPISDIDNNGWGPAPLYEQINEVSPNDANYVSTDHEDECVFFTVGLCEVQEPALADKTPGKFILRVRLRQTGTGSVPVQVDLMEGAAVIASRTFQPTGSFETESIELTESEINAITDYTNLAVHVSAGTCSSSSSSSSSSSNSSSSSGESSESSSSSSSSSSESSSSSSSSSSSKSSESSTQPGVPTSCCENEIPTALVATFTGDLNGTGMIYFDSSQTWIGEIYFEECSEPSYLHFNCVDGVWAQLAFAANGSSAESVSCLPFIIVFTKTLNEYVPPCFVGATFTLTVTE